MPDDLRSQIEPLHALVRAHGWPLLMVEGVEADDVIGTLAKRAKRLGIDTTISSSDKDLAQLVEPGITMVNTMSNETLDEAGVVAKFGVRADQVLDMLTLTGDSVDNVPGVDKVGPKTAAKWLAEYGTLDNLVQRAGEVGGKVGENLRAALDWLPRGRELLTVKTDCALPLGPKDLAPAAPDGEALRSLYERYGFKSWLREVAGGPTAGVPADAAEAIAARAAKDDTRRFDPAQGGHVAKGKPADLAYECVLDAKAFARWRDGSGTRRSSRSTPRRPASTRWRRRSSGCRSRSRRARPATSRSRTTTRARRTSSRATRCSANCAPGSPIPKARKVGQNVKYDEHALANHGIALAGVAHDTLLESYVLEAHRPHDMDSLAWRHLDWKAIAYAEVAGKGASQIGFDQVAVDRATEYSAEDADVTLRLHEALYPQLEADAKLKYVYEALELPAREVLFRMERTGVLIDADLLRAHSRTLGERVVALEQQAFQLAGGPFNLASPKQLGEILFERMKMPVQRKTATGQPSTDEEVLQELAADYPLPKVLLEHRALSKLKSTYTDKLPQMVNPRTGRVHTTFSQATAVTGRLASSDPNLQNIPVRTEEGRKIREAFIAPPGHVLVSADYSQIELRIMAHLSGDPALVRAFEAGEDIHRATAGEIFGVPPADVTADQRRYIKAVNFGLIYGMGAFGLAQQLGIERGAAQQFIDKYFQRYPGVAEYMQRTRELAREQGYVETVFGRRLWLTDIKAGGGPRRAAAERQAINAPMQGTAADLVKLAMIAVARLDRRGEARDAARPAGARRTRARGARGRARARRAPSCRRG